MITAEEARAISGKDVKMYTDFIESKIKESAQRGEDKVIIRNQPYCYWLYSSTSGDYASAKVLKDLESNGFTCKMFYEERQLADLGLEISW